MTALRLALASGLLALVVGPAAAHEGRAAPEAPKEASGPLYEPPAPGTYDLPSIRRVSEHRLLGTDGRRAPLLGLGAGRAAVVSFIYRSCTDADGCPLALSVMQRLDAALAKRPDLARRVRLVTVSFDPAHDTPERMKELRRLMAPRGDWRFFTAADPRDLAPVLGDFGQDVSPLRDPDGKEARAIRHVLKVFLVDGRGDVRNIYSTGLLDQRLLMNDLATVLGSLSPGATPGEAVGPSVHRPPPP